MKLSQNLQSILFTLSLLILLAACSSEDQSQQQTQVPPSASAPAPTPTPAPTPVTTAASDADLVIQGGILLDMVADDPNPPRIKGLVVRNGKIDQIIAAGSSEDLPPATTTINAGS